MQFTRRYALGPDSRVPTHGLFPSRQYLTRLLSYSIKRINKMTRIRPVKTLGIRCTFRVFFLACPKISCQVTKNIVPMAIPKNRAKSVELILPKLDPRKEPKAAGRATIPAVIGIEIGRSPLRAKGSEIAKPSGKLWISIAIARSMPISPLLTKPDPA